LSCYNKVFQHRYASLHWTPNGAAEYNVSHEREFTLNKNKLLTLAFISITLFTGFFFYNETTLNYSRAKVGYEVMLYNKQNQLMYACLEENKVPYSKYLECGAESKREHSEGSRKPKYFACLAKEAPACSNIYFVSIEQIKVISWREKIEEKLNFMSYYLASGYFAPAKSWLYLFIILLSVSFIGIYKCASIYAWLKK
jgi:hypothetical protein